MLTGIEPNQILLLLILIGSVVLFFTEWIRLDLTAILIILTLSLTGILAPEDALSGFSSEPAILLAAVFVLIGAMFHTGLSTRLGNWIKRLAVRSLTRAIAVVMPAVALLSAFTHHVTVTGLMLPPMLKFSHENDIPASKLLLLRFNNSPGFLQVGRNTVAGCSVPNYSEYGDIRLREGRHKDCPPGLMVVSLGFHKFLHARLLPLSGWGIPGRGPDRYPRQPWTRGVRSTLN